MKRLLLLFILLILVDTVLATDGFVAYRSNTGASTTSSPKVRYWNNTANGGNGSWSNEIELPSAGSPIRNVVLKQSPISSKIALVTQSDDGNLDGYVCMSQCDNSANWNYSSNIGNVGVGNQRRFDLSFETDDGALMLVYAIVDANTVRDLGYKVLEEANISFDNIPAQYIDDTGQAANIQYTWVAIDSNPVNTSNEMIVTGFDNTDTDINAWVWNGTGWGSQIQISGTATATGGFEALAVKYAADGSKGMVLGGDGTVGLVQWQYWNGASWTAGNFDSDAGNGDDVRYITLKADPSTDDLQAVFYYRAAARQDLGTAYWSGAAWSVTSAIDTAVDSDTTRVADFSWLPTGSTGRLIWDTDGAGTTLSVRTCSPQCTAATQTFSSYAGTGAWLTLFRNPTLSDAVEFLGLRLNNAFDIGSFSYNGTTLNYTDYGDAAITADTTVTTFESYGFDYRRDVRPPGLTFVTPASSGIVQKQDYVFFNVTSNEYLSVAILEWNGTNSTMNILTNTSWYYNLTGLGEGFYTYKVYGTDLAGNTNVTPTRNITIDFPPNITLINPSNNTLNITSRNITFFYNVSGGFGSVNNCSLIIDGATVFNMSSPISQTNTNNVTYLLKNGQHNWSIYCNDTYGFNSTSEIRNLTIQITPVVNSISLDDGIAPSGQIMLNAGSTRYVNCTVTATDPDGISNILNATGKFYYYLNLSSNPDDNNTHYSNTSCSFVSNTSINKTFECGFNILYYANNGTWNCNVTVNNNYSNGGYSNISNIVQPLYAVNLTDGINFLNVSSGFPSNNITANITNFGNMIVNITLQGYARFIGDNNGMNCSDGSNITITNIRFSTNTSSDFPQKTQMTGSIQPLNFQIKKQTNTTLISNNTYWQINPDPGVKNRICGGYVIFSAEAP